MPPNTVDTTSEAYRLWLAGHLAYGQWVLDQDKILLEGMRARSGGQDGDGGRVDRNTHAEIVRPPWHTQPEGNSGAEAGLNVVEPSQKSKEQGDNAE